MFRFSFVLLVSALMLGCGGPDVESEKDGQSGKTFEYQGDGPIQVMCTTGQVADIIRAVGGEHVNVDFLMKGEGVDPHSYEASQNDITKLAEAKIVFYSGYHLEGKFDQILSNMGKQKPTVAVAESIEKSRLISEDEHTVDPHIWFDAKLWGEAAIAAGEALAKFDASHQEDYRKNAKAYQTKLLELDEFCKTELAKIPEGQRVLVTAHDAFSYFARAYGMEVRAIQGISTAAKASVKDIQELADYLVEKKIKSLFVEKSVNEANMEALKAGCKAQGHTVTTGGTLYSDSMGAPDTDEGTYEGMIRYNVKTIVDALK